MRKLNALLGAVALVGFFAVASANAGSPSGGTVGPVPATNSITSELTNFDNNSGLSFQKFNPSLGSLQKVTLSITGRMKTALTAHAVTHSTGVWSQTLLYLNVQDSGNNLVGDALPLGGGGASTPLITLAVDTSGLKQNITAGHDYTWSGLTATHTVSNDYTSGAVLSEFTGLGNYFLRVATDGDTGVYWRGGNATASQNASASVTGTVTYEYSSVPEATTLLLGLAAGAPLLLHRGRRAKKTA